MLRIPIKKGGIQNVLFYLVCPYTKYVKNQTEATMAADLTVKGEPAIFAFVGTPPTREASRWASYAKRLLHVQSSASR